ncbi:MAG: histidine--tRNA ligase [Pseudomonadales bacterium]
MSTSNFQSVKGMNDILPTETAVWQHLEQCAADLFAAYGYREIRLPIVEVSDLFARSIGEVTDIVEKEMYTFEDRNEQKLSLRPEGTAGCVRACIQHGLLHNQTQKLWYTGPMFRYERPQKGRQRQFHQIGVEVFGVDGPDIDAELMILTNRLWQDLGISKDVVLEINSLGTLDSRNTYKHALQEFLRTRFDDLDADSQRRLETNPLRILDSKNSGTQDLLDNAPSLADYIDEESREHFAGLCERLDAVGIEYKVNPRLVRGLDYYGKTVFEWVTETLGAQGTVCAGGRYDGLVEQLGGKPCTGVGFAMGMERLCLMLDQQSDLPLASDLDAYFIVADPKIEVAALRIAESLREALPQLRLQLHCGGGSMKSQMKKADKSGAQWALIFAEQEHEAGTVSLKHLRETSIAQQSIPIESLAEHLLPTLG